uniref:Uncharacterized protein n=1 Tax=Aegilops tauschii subsp. strangulata TaxID=200361 RepID=A0A453KZX1_AEGTS
ARPSRLRSMVAVTTVGRMTATSRGFARIRPSVFDAGGSNHTSRGCTRPRSPSDSPPAQLAPALRVRAPAAPAPAGRLLPPPPGPPPPGAVRLASPSPTVLPPPPPGLPPAVVACLDRAWSDVARGSSVGSGSGVGPQFSVPFEGPVGAEQVAEDTVDCCFLESGADLCALEDELRRAVVVSVVDAHRQVDLATAAAALHALFNIGPSDMSIRAYHPEDFLVLCGSEAIRETMVDRGRALARGFSLSLWPWSRHAQATGIGMSFLVQLALVGVPANAWTRRAAQEVLRGTGVVVKVADSTARRHDMSRFRVWLKTDDLDRIPARRILVMEESSSRCGHGRVEGVDALWYPVEIIREAPPVRPGGSPSDHRPPPPSPPSADGDEEDDRLARGGRDGFAPRGPPAPSPAGSPRFSTASAPPARSHGRAPPPTDEGPAGQGGAVQLSQGADIRRSSQGVDQVERQGGLPAESVGGRLTGRHVES